MRERWLGASGLRVPEIAVEGADLDVLGPDRVAVGGRELPALVLDEPGDPESLRAAHARGTAIVVRADGAGEVAGALEHPEVSCAVVPPDRADLRELDLRRLKYG